MTRRAAFLEAGEITLALLRHPDVAARWTQQSALPGMTIGGLAHHLGVQVVSGHSASVDRALRGVDSPVTLVEHYRRAAWVRADIDDEANLSIRTGAERSAGDGPGAVVSRVARALADLQPWPTDSLQSVQMPWWHWSMTADDFLLTRMMEMMVHADDLAASLGVETPVFPRTVARQVFTLLAAVAVDTHGQAAVLRALTRSERASSIVVF
ncbi:MAG: maleylpyruvate isomerase N-terminal domain-containing protein [Nocardioides sp.]